MTNNPAPQKPEKIFTDEPFAEMARDVLQLVAQEREHVIKAIEKQRTTPRPMDTAENLHKSLTLAFATLHRIAQMPCQTCPEEAAEDEARRGYRSPCREEGCAPCIAFRALIVEGQLPG